MNIDYPFHFGAHGRTAPTGYDDHVRDLIEQVLFTNPGERVNRPDFGGGVMQLVFATGHDGMAEAVKFTLRAALERWLGDVIEVQNLEASFEDSSLLILLGYVVRRTGTGHREQFERPFPG
jgi:phage baseplate assembly protein W